MADLSNTTRWVRYEPDLRGNRELERPFYVLLNGSMSKAQLQNLTAALSTPLSHGELPPNATKEQADEYAESGRKALVKRQGDALRPFVKFGSEPLSIDGEAIDSLDKYLDYVSRSLVGHGAFFELSQALTDCNLLDTASSFFSGRLSGGFVGTGSRSNGKGEGQRAAR